MSHITNSYSGSKAISYELYIILLFLRLKRNWYLPSPVLDLTATQDIAETVRGFNGTVCWTLNEIACKCQTWLSDEQVLHLSPVNYM